MEKTTQSQEFVEAKNSGQEMIMADPNSIRVPENYIRRSHRNIASLEKSIERDGILQSIYVYRDNSGTLTMIDGACRLAVAIKLGITELSCIIINNTDEVKAAHMSYVFNAERNNLTPIDIAKHISWMRNFFTIEDLELKGYGSQTSIKNQLKLLELPSKVQDMLVKGEITSGHALELTRLSTDLEKEKMAKKAKDKSLTVKVLRNKITRYREKDRNFQNGQPGRFEPGKNVPDVYFKDSSKMDELPNESVALIVTSPNYHVGKEFESGISFSEHCANNRLVMDECTRVLTPGGFMVVNVMDISNFKASKTDANASVKLMGHRFQSWLNKRGVFLQDIIIWEKPQAWNKNHRKAYNPDMSHTSYRPFNNWEYIYVYRKKGERTIEDPQLEQQSRLNREQYMKFINGVWKIRTVSGKDGHPCPFPEELCERIIRMYSYVGDTVLDPFLGSGTTIKVARALGRYGVGYERFPEYRSVIMSKLGIKTEEQPEMESHDDTIENVGVIMKPDEESFDSSEPSGIEKAFAAMISEV